MACKDCGNTIKNIVDGYTNTIFKKADIEELANTRLQECSNCNELKVVGVFNATVLHYCNLCKCPITPAVRAKGKQCKLNKW